VDKATPHFTLDDILAQMVTVDEMNLTLSARNGIWDAGLTQAEALSVVQNLTRSNFYKSMTTHADHRIWQDVYHGHKDSLAFYIKFQRAGDYFIVSFKEL
jgi:motility quorum-sensing regulator / GCU-specific mRNA interferase toxin